MKSKGVILTVMILALSALAWAQAKETVIYSFQGGSDGSYPAGNMVMDQAGESLRRCHL